MAELATTLASTEADRLDQAEGLVRAYCGWHIAPSRSVTERVPFVTGVAVLRSLHVTELTSVTLPDGTLLDPADYDWSEAGVITRLPGQYWWSERDSSATVVYQSGWEPVPPELVGVVRAVAQRGVDNPHGVARQTTGPFSVDYADASALVLLDADKAVLDRYKLPPRP